MGKVNRVQNHEYPLGLPTQVDRHGLCVAQGDAFVRQLRLASLVYCLQQAVPKLEEFVRQQINKVIFDQVPVVGEAPIEFKILGCLIIEEEAKHTQWSFVKLRNWSKELTGLPAIPHAEPVYLEALAEAKRHVPASCEPLIEFAWELILESALATLLRDESRNPQLHPEVRNLLIEHAEEEKKHNSIHQRIFSWWFSRLSAETKRIIGPTLAQAIKALVAPEYSFFRQLLGQTFSAAEVERILSESYPESILIERARDIGQPSIHLIRDNGLLEDPLIAEEFYQEGLID